MAAPGPKNFKMSELKSKILRPAQTSVYMVDITTGGNLNKFASARGLNMAVDSEMINLSCCEASLPGSSLATHEVTNDYHGVTEKMAYRRIYDDSIDLTFYVDYQYKVIEFLNSWINYVVGEGSFLTTEQYKSPSAFYRMNWPKDYRSDIYLTKFEKDYGTKGSMNSTLKYQFIGAFPTNMVSIPISYEASDLLKVTVSFNYLRYVRTSAFGSAPSTTSVPTTPTAQSIYNNGTNASIAGLNGFAEPSSYLTTPEFSAGTTLPSDGFGSPLSSPPSFTQAEYNTAIDQELAVQATGQAPAGGFTLF